ncbi:hypothetical protein [Pseudofrankia asymbiotica]|uniref:Uncharacterized protein n=1 Tax=Pseudofrankia asymbiotica TaxID=1834516 RepID=A0A1V2I3U4_9ACTN|nr:hypothetical protein [Pseudofrankia asymbiotica]ONH25186.1 hypothetical protein BL253_27845 [Pseudofrankia asymbiotica]
MFSVLVDGRTVDTVDDDESVTVEIGGDDTTYRCSSCGNALSETADGHWLDECGGADCPDADPDNEGKGGGHVPAAVPLSWCNHVRVHADESQDSVTVYLRVGTKSFALAARRIPDDAESVLAGRLLLDVPHPDAPGGHGPLTPLRDGTYLIGS